MKTLLFLLWPFLASAASWQAGIGTGAYLGTLQLQAQRSSDNLRHHTQVILGRTDDSILGPIFQVSGAYAWSAFNSQTIRDLQWNPLNIGGFFTWTNHKRFFFHSPSRYPSDASYAVTNFRYGLRFSTELTSYHLWKSPITFALDGSLLENGIIAWVNQPREFQTLKYHWSLGLSARIPLDTIFPDK